MVWDISRVGPESPLVSQKSARASKTPKIKGFDVWLEARRAPVMTFFTQNCS